MRAQFLEDWKKFTAKDQSTYGYTPANGEFALTFSPRFFVAHQGRLLESAASQYGWKHYIAPLLEKLLGS